MISPRQSVFLAVEELRTVDPYTVEFVLAAPRGFMPAAIANGWNVIERKKTLEDNNLDLKKVKPGTTIHPGTGPFILEDHQAGEFWKASRNPNYWNPELPYLDGIQHSHLAYGPATGAALITGRVDYVYGAGADLRDDIRQNYSDTHTVVVYPIPSIGGMFVNHESDGLNDARVRRAIQDRCAIKVAVAAIREIEVGTWIVPNDPDFGASYREDTLNQKPGYNCPATGDDVSNAQQLLADAGYPNGEGFPTLDLMVRDINFLVSPMAPMMQAFMKQSLNINSEIRVVHTSVWQEDRDQGNYDLAVNGTPTPLASTPAYWGSWFSTGSGSNWNRGSSNPEFDSLVDELIGPTDPRSQGGADPARSSDPRRLDPNDPHQPLHHHRRLRQLPERPRARQPRHPVQRHPLRHRLAGQVSHARQVHRPPAPVLHTGADRYHDHHLPGPADPAGRPSRHPLWRGGSRKPDRRRHRRDQAATGHRQASLHPVRDWMKDVFTGKMGESFWRGDSVSELIIRRGPLTAEIAVVAVMVSWIIGLPVGILGAIKQNSVADYVSRFLTIIFLAVPSFWVAILVVVVSLLAFNYRPPLGIIQIWEDPFTNLQIVVAPGIVLGLATSAYIARMARTTLLEVIRDDYVRTARAKGLPERLVVLRHALRNALLPVLTLSGVLFACCSEDPSR